MNQEEWNRENTAFEIVMYVSLLAIMGFVCLYFGIDLMLDDTFPINYLFGGIFLLISGLFFSKIIIYFLNEKEQPK